MSQSSDSSQPRNLRLLSELYDETEEVELSDELFLMGVDEPVNYSQATKKREWREAIEREIEAIEKNQT